MPWELSKLCIGPVAAGPSAPWHVIHPFVQTLAGIRNFVVEARPRHIRNLCLYLVDPRVWSPITSGKIRILELLSSELSRMSG